MERVEEILMEYLKGEKGKGYTERYAIVAAMHEYAQEQVKLCNILHVSQQRELLKVLGKHIAE